MDLYVRPCAGAIVHCGGKILMHKRSMSARYMPGRWSTPGGHIEEDELTTPRVAGVRELCEETGLTEGQFSVVRLKYAKLEIEGGRLVPAFDYEAWTDQEHILTGDGEGEPQWVADGEILGLDLMDKSRIMMDHVLNRAEAGRAYFIYDAENGPEFYPMNLHDDMRLYMTAGAEGGEGVAVLSGEMHDPSAAVKRALGDMWTDAHTLAGVRVTVEKDQMTLRFSYAQSSGEPYVDIVTGGVKTRHRWNGWQP